MRELTFDEPQAKVTAIVDAATVTLEETNAAGHQA